MTYRNTTLIVVDAIVTLIITIAPALAQAPTTEHRIQELVRIAVQQVVSGEQQNPQPADANDTGVPVDTRSVVALSLDDVVKPALDRNLTIAVQRFNPPQFDPAIASLRATYWPQVTSMLATQSTANPPTAGTIGIPSGATAVSSGVTTFNGGYAQNVPWGGGQLGVAINNVKNTTTSTTALYNPAYLPTDSAAFTQPLLRGFAIDSNRQRLLVTKIQRDISDVQLKSTILRLRGHDAERRHRPDLHSRLIMRIEPNDQLDFQAVQVDLEQTTPNTANVTLLGGAAWGNGAQAIGNLTGAPVGSAR